MPPATVSAFTRPAPADHDHDEREMCPWCEQPVSHEKFSEITRQMEEREQQKFAQMRSDLDAQYAQEKADLQQKAAGEIDELQKVLAKQREEAAQASVTARLEGKSEAEALAREQFVKAQQAHAEKEVALRNEVEEAQQRSANLQSQLMQSIEEKDGEIARIKDESVAREEIIRKEAIAAADSSLRQKAADAESKLSALTESSEQERARLLEQLAESERAKASAQSEADAKVSAAQEQLAQANASHEVALNSRLQEQREALDREKTDAINAEKAKAFEETQKHLAKAQELQRALDSKTNEELGEGAEIDLFEQLKREFESDRIERISKGTPGADIKHVIVHNGQECGTIIYDSKNRNQWRNDYVNKLASDQLAAKAEHAILSTQKFPADTRQLHIQDGVIVANPARVVDLVHIVRKHSIQNHTLRLSNSERGKKTAALYAFITSEQCTQLLNRIDTHTEDLLELQISEKKAHDRVWKRQGELVRNVQKVRGDLSAEIDRIVGTGGGD